MQWTLVQKLMPHEAQLWHAETVSDPDNLPRFTGVDLTLMWRGCWEELATTPDCSVLSPVALGECGEMTAGVKQRLYIYVECKTDWVRRHVRRSWCVHWRKTHSRKTVYSVNIYRSLDIYRQECFDIVARLIARESSPSFKTATVVGDWSEICVRICSCNW